MYPLCLSLIHIYPNAQTAEMLHVSIYARPKELHPENETAKFSIQSGSSSWTCSALLGQDNAYSGDTEIPMRDAFSVYLVLTDEESGMVRNILVDHLTGVEDAYTLQFSSRWQTGGIASDWGGTHVSGYLEIQVYSLAPVSYTHLLELETGLRRFGNRLEHVGKRRDAGKKDGKEKQESKQPPHRHLLKDARCV